MAGWVRDVFTTHTDRTLGAGTSQALFSGPEVPSVAA